MTARARDDGTVIIKKYANRRLYDTESSAYVTLDHVAAMVRDKRDFKVIDAKTGEDITRSVLTQIIVEEEARGATMLPVNFLKQLIGLYGNSMQAVVPQFLEDSLEALQKSHAQLGSTMTGAFAANPLAELARRNIEMMTAAAASARPAPSAPDRDGEIERLKAELAELKAKVDKLSG